MIALPADLAELLAAGAGHGAAVFLRVAALVSVLPAFGERSVPARVRLAAAVLFAAAVAPAVAPAPDLTGIAAMIRLALGETAVGLALGLSLRLFVLALQTAGAIAAQSTSLSQAFGGAGAEPAPAIGHVLVLAGLALAAMSGLHVRAAGFMILSYDLVPAGSLPGAQALSHWGVGQVARAFALGFALAAPFVIASVLYNLMLGAINRAMPQLMVAFVGAPAITFGGLALLLAAAPLMLRVWSGALTGFIDAAGGALR